MNIQEKLTTIAENVTKVYEAGVAEGRVQQANDFMESFQQGGKRTDYSYAFANWGEVNNPSLIYDVVVSGAYSASSMFYHSGIPDIVKWLGNKRIDISRATSISNMCQAAKSISLPPFDMSNVINATLAFYNISNVNKLTLLNVNPNCVWDRTFNYSKFVELEITGTIGKTISFGSNYYLNKESIINIMNCLSTETSGVPITISKTAVDKAFATTEGGTDGSTSAEWEALCNTRTNWTITLQG